MKRPLVIIHGAHKIEADRIVSHGDGVLCATLKKGETIAVISPGSTGWSVEPSVTQSEEGIFTEDWFTLVKPELVELLNALEGRRILTRKSSTREVIRGIRDYLARHNADRIAKIEARISAIEAGTEG